MVQPRIRRYDREPASLQLCVSMRITISELESAEIAILVFEREFHVRVDPV